VSNAAFPQPGPTVFGPMVGASDVREAMSATVQTWAGAYIAEMAALTGAALSPFQSWKVLYEYRTLPASEAPACWVTCTGTHGRPERQGNGRYMADWAVDVSVVVNGTTWDEAADRTAAYVTAVRTAILQHGSLGGLAQSTTWLGERYTAVDHSATRTLGVGLIAFGVRVDNVVNASAGPATPTAGPALAPTIATGRVAVVNKRTSPL